MCKPRAGHNSARLQSLELSARAASAAKARSRTCTRYGDRLVLECGTRAILWNYIPVSSKKFDNSYSRIACRQRGRACMRQRRSILREVAAHQQQALHIPPRIASSTTPRFLSSRRHEELTSSPGWQVLQRKPGEHLLTRQVLSMLAGMFDLSKVSIPSIQCFCFASTFTSSISPFT